jgi:hypothetical protein
MPASQLEKAERFQAFGELDRRDAEPMVLLALKDRFAI